MGNNSTVRNPEKRCSHRSGWIVRELAHSLLALPQYPVVLASGCDPDNGTLDKQAWVYTSGVNAALLRARG